MRKLIAGAAMLWALGLGGGSEARVAAAQAVAATGASPQATATGATRPQDGVAGAPLTEAEASAMRRRIMDWAQLGVYREADAALGAPAAGERRVVFYGSSTTEGWGRVKESTFFPGKPYVNRGIGGQTTSQMLVRFRQDVVALKPAAVVFLGGTNDPAGNTGEMTEAMTEDNVRSMVEIAKANGIRFLLGSQLPVVRFPWAPTLEPKERLLAMSAFERCLAAEQGLEYIDYYSVLAGADGRFKPGFSNDGVHPTAAAYAAMAPLAERAIAAAENHP